MRSLLSLLVVLLLALPARAGPLAPNVATHLHQRVQAQLDALMTELPEEARARLVGTYVAFDADRAHAYALISCDDDGDAVIVVSDALIEVLQRVAEAATDDELQGTRKLEGYAKQLAIQTGGAPLLPPPPGFYAGDHDPAREGVLFDEAARGVLGQELARLHRRHLVCAHPTAARERADDEWTRDERAYAFALAEKLYDDAHLTDADAIALPWVRGRVGYARFLRAMAIVEPSIGRASVPYAPLHPKSAARASAVEGL